MFLILDNTVVIPWFVFFFDFFPDRVSFTLPSLVEDAIFVMPEIQTGTAFGTKMRVAFKNGCVALRAKSVLETISQCVRVFAKLCNNLFDPYNICYIDLSFLSLHYWSGR